MNTNMVVSASIVISLVGVSCGSDTAAVCTDAFSDQLASVCRTIDRGVANLDNAATLDDVRSNANDASGLYEAGLNELKKLKLPTSDQEFKGDVEGLIASFGDQLDTLDAIAKAAKDCDQEGVDSGINTLTQQNSDSNDLAESLDISRCQIDAAFDVAPDTTEPDVSLTLPVFTSPPETFPVDPYLSNDIPTTPLTIGTLEGVTWSDPDGTSYFLIGVSNVVLWALAPTADLLTPTLKAWGESVSQ